MISVQVTWFDAHADATAWTDLSDLDKETRVIESVGWLVSSKDDHVTLAQSYVDDVVDSVIHIPRVNVLNISYLKKKK